LGGMVKRNAMFEYINEEELGQFKNERGIQYYEVSELLNNFTQRIKIIPEIIELDYSQKSLDVLSSVLIKYCNNQNITEIIIDKNLINIIKETMAYIGEVFMRGYKMEWVAHDYFWQTIIFYNKPVTAIKGEVRVTHKRTGIPLYDLASRLIINAVKNKKLVLSCYYKVLKKKVVREP